MTPDQTIEVVESVLKECIKAFPPQAFDEPDVWRDFTCEVVLTLSHRGVYLISRERYDELIRTIRRAT